jgi:hypothetical protein
MYLEEEAAVVEKTNLSRDELVTLNDVVHQMKVLDTLKGGNVGVLQDERRDCGR